MARANLKIAMVTSIVLPPDCTVVYCRTNNIKIKSMKLKKFLLRYQPPGIGFEYIQQDEIKTKMIDLLDLSSSTDVDILADDIMRKERLVTPSVRSRLVDSLIKLQKKATECKKFKRYAVLDTHLLPITNAAFDHQGTMCLTGSYDRTCKVWSVHDGVEAATLSGHTNVVFSVAFIPQHQNRVVTGSFDRTAKVWDWEITNGDSMMVSLEGHSAEVVALAMDSTSPNIATGSMDSMAKIFDLGTGVELSTLVGHTKPVIRVVFGDNMLVTASFDSTVRLWDMRKRPSCVSVLQGHSAEISGCVLSPDGLLLATSSLDGTAKIWDLRSTIFIATMDHTDEVLDIGFDSNGRRLVTCCSDCNIKIWDVKCGNFVLPSTVCLGHTDEVSKVSFSPDGTCVLSASADCTAKLWDSDNGRLLEDLAGVHSDEVFCCEFSVDGNTLLTASKDNTCQLWRKPSMGNDEELAWENGIEMERPVDGWIKSFKYHSASLFDKALANSLN